MRDHVRRRVVGAVEDRAMLGDERCIRDAEIASLLCPDGADAEVTLHLPEVGAELRGRVEQPVGRRGLVEIRLDEVGLGTDRTGRRRQPDRAALDVLQVGRAGRRIVGITVEDAAVRGQRHVVLPRPDETDAHVVRDLRQRHVAVHVHVDPAGRIVGEVDVALDGDLFVARLIGFQVVLREERLPVLDPDVATCLDAGVMVVRREGRPEDVDLAVLDLVAVALDGRAEDPDERRCGVDVPEALLEREDALELDVGRRGGARRVEGAGIRGRVEIRRRHAEIGAEAVVLRPCRSGPSKAPSRSPRSRGRPRRGSYRAGTALGGGRDRRRARRGSARPGSSSPSLRRSTRRSRAGLPGCGRRPGARGRRRSSRGRGRPAAAGGRRRARPCAPSRRTGRGRPAGGPRPDRPPSRCGRRGRRCSRRSSARSPTRRCCPRSRGCGCSRWGC